MKDKVRMNISREMHEWFTAIDGDTNDERMSKLKTYKEKGDELNELYMKRGQTIVSMMQTSHRYQELYYKSCNNNRILKALLGLSMTVSIISVGYLAYVQGWFL
ncbi:hypothetical protein VPSG_00044 [Vibrio phage pYD38-B]|uniref:hypothetical protein n=1 Tax=Vibrio phage pYD38-B TaxID=929835 RepID=UPI0003424F06|nr:hypothetical protein VPSG_00044 [Vibrio phage pYD38-B]AGN34363.1 hypothetical protein VPSG_00044 [Vibrio phage pYD38-B]